MPVRPARAIAVSAVAAVLTGLIAATPAAAAAKPITGTLTKAGYRVVAVTPGGAARTARVSSNGSFRIVPRGPVVTLSLVTKKGRYAGPVVVGGAAKRVVLGVKAGTRLGTVRVRPGWARAAVPRARTTVSMWARARHGKPVGAGRNGLVRSKAVGTAGVGRDQDSDGVVGAFDIDDDGDLLIDNFERAGVGTSFLAGPGDEFRVFSNFKLDISASVNANGGGTERIPALVRDTVTLAISVPAPPATGELDCLGLTYCSTGGTGRVLGFGGAGSSFPADLDADGDGMGDLVAGQTGDFQLSPGATPDLIRAGDTFVTRVSPGGGGAQEERPGVLNFVFSTTPALTTYSVAGGTSGTVTYPVPPGATGTMTSPIPVPAGSATVSLTFWRPQRPAVAGESASSEGFVDVGGLTYVADIPNGPAAPGAGSGSAGPGTCRSGYATTDPDATLSGEGIQDRVTDRAASAANTLSFSLDLDACLSGTGTWDTGEVLGVDIQAKTPYGDNAAQKIYFVRQ